MNYNWSIICKKSVVEAETNIISLFEIMEKITVGQHVASTKSVIVPEQFVMPLDFELVTYFSGISKNIFKPFLKIELFNQQGEKMGETEHELKVNSKDKVLRSRIIFNTIKIKGDGMYTFKVNLKENEKESYNEIASIPLEVEILRPIK